MTSVISPVELVERKTALRRQLLGRRSTLTKQWIEAQSAAVLARAETCPEVAAAGTIACYLAMPREVQTDRLVEELLACGKRVCVPAGDLESGSYRFAWFDGESGVRVGRMGLREPARVRWAPPAEIEVVLVPGVAYDASGRRLGHGGGHYDRMLGNPAIQRALFAGLAFEFQVADTVPSGDEDVGVAAVVTERRVIRCERGTG